MVCNTDSVPFESLGHLYHYGALHIQATDPQSVDSGVPYRMFQTGMSGKPLLTDWKPGWSNLFSKTDYFVYEKYEEIPDLIEKAMSDKDVLKEKGKLNHKRCIDNHTWGHRIAKLQIETNDPMRGLLLK
jgi:spore maturation protein CgeB